MTRFDDGSAGDANYGVIGRDYMRFRQPDPRIAAYIHAPLGDAERVLNVGAGAGSYEPTDRDVTAVEPSASMRAQRPAHLARAIDAVAAALPFTAGRLRCRDDAVLGASMAGSRGGTEGDAPRDPRADRHSHRRSGRRQSLLAQRLRA